ncbi:hypothetical protein ACHAXT_006674 [Thalassiosira profunda]
MAGYSRGGPTSTTAAYTTSLKSGSSYLHAGGGSNNRAYSSASSSQQSLAHALLPDLPLLMHGSGDVLPEEVHPHSVATLAQLIEKYVASLVSAAMDAHDVFTDGEVVGGGACLGVPPFGAAAGVGNGRKSEDEDEEDEKKRKAGNQKMQKRRKKRRIDYWDVPLPRTGEDHDEESTVGSDSGLSDDDTSDDDAPLSGFRRMSSSASASAASFTPGEAALRGFAPLDLHADERTRQYYVAAPTVMDARSFIFPVCHDATLYQRIKEVQASRRAIRRDVVDDSLMELMKEEGGAIGRWGAVDMMDAVLGNGDSPGKAGDIATAKGGDKMVGAGLLDADVDPSWPGLNSLSRGKLW